MSDLIDEYGVPYTCFAVDTRHFKPTPMGSARNLFWKIGNPIPDVLTERGSVVRPSGVCVWDNESVYNGRQISV